MVGKEAEATLQGPQNMDVSHSQMVDFWGKAMRPKFGTFFLNFETPSKYAGKDSSSYFAGLPFKGIFLWGDDYRIIIHFEVINVQLTLYQPAFWKGGNSHPCHLYSQENLHVP